MKNMKMFNSSDVILLFLLVIVLIGTDFGNLTVIQYIMFGAFAVWLGLVIYKAVLKRKG
ncbi:hypothetical protein [Alkalihalobacillus sp. LMS39]|uniref:hypothetical protein n=1 Tax=Alkalihalobacillus sp. LMS39 TaxID=2924032 RepID=UPI001FB3D58E|nr:hypothetical protein [Alkalihalobacillus sp. LMS39]UOE96085.1 hypothetical protein MM271_10995 [Alkalihalobacillus sp. LMS39]